MKTESIISQIKKDLLKGKRLTTMKVIEKYQYTRLAAAINLLNPITMVNKSFEMTSSKEITWNEILPIKSEWKTNKKTGKRYKEYFI